MVLLVSLLACTPVSPTPAPGPSANYSGSLGPEPDFSLPHSSFQVWIYEAESAAVFSGAFADGPPLRLHTESAREGNCRIVTYTPTSCSPTCSVGTELCVEGRCEAYPHREDHGDIQWTFAGGAATIHPDETLSYSATESGAEVGETSMEFEGTTLIAPGTEPLEPMGDWESALQNRGSGAVTLRWSNPTQGTRVRLRMTDCMGTHGGIAANELECEGPDTGELVLPASMLDVMEGGAWDQGECGGHTFDRVHIATPEGEPLTRFEFVAGSSVYWFPGRSSM